MALMWSAGLQRLCTSVKAGRPVVCCSRHARHSFSTGLGKLESWKIPIYNPQVIRIGKLHTSCTSHHGWITSKVVNMCRTPCFGFRFAQSRAQAKPLPFEVDTKVPKDVVIFTFKKDRFFMLMTIFGIVQFFFWCNLGVFVYSTMKSFRADTSVRVFDKQSQWGRVLEYVSRYSDKAAAMCFLFGYLALFVTWVYPQRTIQTLALLKGGQNVRVVTYTHFGRTRELNVPLEHISGGIPRDTKGPWASIKIKGRWWFFLLDKKGGRFREPALFDLGVALKRDLK